MRNTKAAAIGFWLGFVTKTLLPGLCPSDVYSGLLELNHNQAKEIKRLKRQLKRSKRR